jgi:signal peptidase I
MANTYASQVIDEQSAKPRQAFWKELPVLLGVAILVAVLVRAFLLQTFYIPTESMEHTLNINDRVLVNKLVYDVRDPHRGEIVVFVAPDAWRSDPAEKDFIKRVIGLPGDRVMCCDGQGRITVNGHPLDEPYLYQDPRMGADVPSRDAFNIVVPPDRLWVMGDHRSRSSDSREQYKEHSDVMRATIAIHDVVGRAFVLFWPVNRTDWLTVPETFDQIPSPTAG